MHFDPSALPRLGDEPGRNRFDDPRPRTVHRFLVRYGASTLRGCLLELLAPFRNHDAVESAISRVEDDDPHSVPAPEAMPWSHLADFLRQRRVASISAEDPEVASVNDALIQAELDLEPAVRAVLDSAEARAALLPAGGSRVQLDNAAIRLSAR